MVKLGIIKEDNIMSDNTNNGFPVPEEPRTREEQYLSAIAGVTEATEIPEKPRTRVEAYLNEIVENGGGSVYDKLEAGTNINIEETSDGKAKISATGEVSSEDTYAREQIANHIADKDNPHEVSAADVGLGNCDNTSDLNKPISTATQTALNLKADKTELPEVPITTVKVNNEPLVPASGAVNITVPTQASDVHALADSVKYAGASTAGGSATSAAKLDTASAGSATQPVYFANGIPTATSYSLEKSVPSNAVFTDTTYESKAAASGGTDVSLCTTGEKYTWNSKQNAIDSSHKLSADLVDDTSTTNKFATAAELEQIETNKNNISKITPTTTYKTNHAFQSADYELINDVYIDVPDGKRIFLVVGAKQSNVTGIAVCFNTQTYDAAKVVISQEVSTAQQMISCAGCYDNGNGGQSYRLSVFAKGVAGSQLNCRITLSWWYL